MWKVADGYPGVGGDAMNTRPALATWIPIAIVVGLVVLVIIAVLVS
jgi:hypothetical protein